MLKCVEHRGNWPRTSHSVQSSCLAGKTNFSPFFFFVWNRRHSTIGWILFLVEVKSVSAWKIHDPEKVIFNEYLWAMSFLIRAVQVFWSLPLRLACDFYQKNLWIKTKKMDLIYCRLTHLASSVMHHHCI